MFKHLQEIDYKLYERYLTLEKNIKAGSNSFYDAYLDLQEQFVKAVAVFCGFDVKARETCGELLRRDDIKNFFKDVLRVDDFTYTKMQDYTLKVMAIKEINVENGFTSDDAIAYVKQVISYSKKTCIYIIHGYGSSGKGGVIRQKVRSFLNAQVKNGKIKSVINGEDFNVFNFKALELKNKYKELEQLFRVCNHGVTIVEV